MAAMSNPKGTKRGMGPGHDHSEEEARAEIEARVTEIWATAIGCSDVDAHSDFYFEGGNHFLAPVMIQSINEALGLELTVRDLEQGRTIAKLTDLIHFQQTRIDRSTVVPLRNVHGLNPPLFIVHGVGGNVLGFYSLAKCLHADQPVYGIQAQALLPREEALLRLEQMAAKYVEDMRAVCPTGPFHLLGLSFGGLVAYEIAQQLKAAGLEVGLLGMLDTRQPQSMRGMPGRGALHRRFYWRMKMVYLRTHRRKGRLRYLWRRLRERMQRFTYMYAARRGPGKVTTAVRNVREINYVAGVNYTLRPYPGHVTLFRAKDEPYDEPLPADLNWGKFAESGLSIREIPGDHFRILYEPWLSVLAGELTLALGETNLTQTVASQPQERATQGARETWEI
jgi:thioesterase domain-containing protein